jgi:hypothetical protein
MQIKSILYTLSLCFSRHSQIIADDVFVIAVHISLSIFSGISNGTSDFSLYWVCVDINPVFIM